MIFNQGSHAHLLLLQEAAVGTEQDREGPCVWLCKGGTELCS